MAISQGIAIPERQCSNPEPSSAESAWRNTMLIALLIIMAFLLFAILCALRPKWGWCVADIVMGILTVVTLITIFFVKGLPGIVAVNGLIALVIGTPLQE